MRSMLRWMTDKSVIASRYYFGLRLFLRKRRWLIRSAQIVRAWWILGPLSAHAVRYYQRRKHEHLIQEDSRDLFPELEVDHVVNSLNKKGYANGVNVPAIYVTEIVRYCEKTALKEYWNPHQECDAIDHIARNAKIVEIARRYLGAEPILWLTLLRWSFGAVAPGPKLVPSRYKEPLLYDENSFHYDTLDFKSLTLFIYLTDVDPSSGPHVVVEGTHVSKNFVDLCHIVLTDGAAREKFGDRAKVILGQEGMMLFEDTSCWHKASHCQTKRLLLSIDYVLQRRPPPTRMVAALA